MIGSVSTEPREVVHLAKIPTIVNRKTARIPVLKLQNIPAVLEPL